MRAIQPVGSGKRPIVFAAIGAAVILITLLEFVTPPELSFSIFYLIPVAVGIWLLTPVEGLTIMVFTAAILVAVHVIKADQYDTLFVPFWEGFRELVTLLIVGFVLGALRSSLNREATLARTDHLTGAVNGRRFYEIAEMEAARAKRFNYPLSVVYIDIDNFKGINDTLGHAAGDALLKATVASLKKTVRVIDTVARFGGDEFAMILPGTDYDEAHTVIHRARSGLQTMGREHGWKVTFSLGAVTCPHMKCSVDRMITAADTLMYSVKTSGKDGIRHEVVEKEGTADETPPSGRRRGRAVEK